MNEVEVDWLCAALLAIGMVGWVVVEVVAAVGAAKAKVERAKRGDGEP